MNQFYLRLFAIIALLFLSGQDSFAKDAKKKSTSTQQKSFIWEVKNKNNSKIYLAGSMHVGKPDLYPLSKSFEKAFNESDVLVVEVDITPEKHIEIQQYLMKNGIYTNENSLDKVLKPETIKRLKKFIKEIGGQFEVYRKSKPWFLMMTFQQILIFKEGYNPMLGLEFYFSNKAKQLKKRIISLETFSEQIQPLTTLPLNEQELLIIDMIESKDNLKEEIEALINAWKSGNHQKVNNIVFDEMENVPTFKKQMFDDRNKVMFKRIQKYFDDDNIYFVLVGSGHLTGKNGLLKMFEEKNFTLKQLK